jgi:deoxycytidine triphosphate deaminase
MISDKFPRFITPFSTFRANKTSIDITASNIAFRELVTHADINCDEDAFTIDIKRQQPLHLEQDKCMELNGFSFISPGGNLIIETNELITLDGFHCAFYQSVGNLNMSNIASIGNIWMQPSWSGKLQINLHNFNRAHSYKIYKDQPIGQIVVLPT